MRNKGFQLTIALICLVLGLMLGLQFKSVRTNSASDLDQLRSGEVQTKLKETTDKLNETEAKLKEYEDAAFQNGKTAEIIKKDIDNFKMISGVVPVKGPGIIVTLNDNKLASTGAGEAESAYIVHDKDILTVVNELRAIGAEAISVNDQRLVSKSEIRCVGPTISINNIKVSVPYVIKAIGNPDGLESSLKMPGGVIDAYLQPWVDVNIKKQDEITIPKYNGIYTFQYATIDGEDK